MKFGQRVRSHPRTVAVALTAALFLSAKPLVAQPKIEIAINLPEFMLRYYEDGVQKDSARIACGKHCSPVIDVERRDITYRPSFNPTDDEKRAKKPLQPAPPERTNRPAKPHNPLGRRRIVVCSTYRMHGTCWEWSIGRAESNGCIRIENAAVERITDTMVVRLTGKQPADKPGWQHTYHSSVPFKIRSFYRLWDNLRFSDSTIIFRAWPDIHHHLDGRKSANCPVDENVRGNGYTIRHWISSLAQAGITPKPGLGADSPVVQKCWEEFKDALKKNRKKGAVLQLNLPEPGFNLPPHDYHRHPLPGSD